MFDCIRYCEWLNMSLVQIDDTNFDYEFNWDSGAVSVGCSSYVFAPEHYMF